MNIVIKETTAYFLEKNIFINKLRARLIKLIRANIISKLLGGKAKIMTETKAIRTSAGTVFFRETSLATLIHINYNV